MINSISGMAIKNMTGRHKCMTNDTQKYLMVRLITNKTQNGTAINAVIHNDWVLRNRAYATKTAPPYINARSEKLPSPSIKFLRMFFNASPFHPTTCISVTPSMNITPAIAKEAASVMIHTRYSNYMKNISSAYSSSLYLGMGISHLVTEPDLDMLLKASWVFLL